MGSHFFSSAKDVDVFGGTMMSAGGNITIVNGSSPKHHQEMLESVSSSKETYKADNQHNRTRGPNQRSCELYYNNLILKRRGSPLWIPEPPYNLPIAYQRQGVSIGDVGVLSTSGSFNFFFNICYSREHPVNSGGVPQGFLPLEPPLNPRHIQQLQEFNSGSYVASESIVISRGEHNDSVATDLVFESKAEEGAILTMPNGAFSQDITSIIRLRGYIAKNIESWYRYIIKDCECDVDNGDIRLVTGCDKTDSWGMVAFVKSSDAVRLHFQPIGSGKSYKWEYSGSFDARTGPNPTYIDTLRENGDQQGSINNQCLFARTLNATLRDDIWMELKRAIYEEMGINPDEVICHDRIMSPTMRVRPPLSSGMMPHPSNSINQMLWKDSKDKYPTARVIITSDSDWVSVLKANDSFLPNSGELYKRMMAKSPRLKKDEKEEFITLDYPSVKLKHVHGRISQNNHPEKREGEPDDLGAYYFQTGADSDVQPNFALPMFDEIVPHQPQIKINPTVPPIIPGLKEPSPMQRKRARRNILHYTSPSSSPNISHSHNTQWSDSSNPLDEESDVLLHYGSRTSSPIISLETSHWPHPRDSQSAVSPTHSSPRFPEDLNHETWRNSVVADSNHQSAHWLYRRDAQNKRSHTPSSSHLPKDLTHHATRSSTPNIAGHQNARRLYGSDVENKGPSSSTYSSFIPPSAPPPPPKFERPDFGAFNKRGPGF